MPEIYGPKTCDLVCIREGLISSKNIHISFGWNIPSPSIIRSTARMPAAMNTGYVMLNILSVAAGSWQAVMATEARMGMRNSMYGTPLLRSSTRAGTLIFGKIRPVTNPMKMSIMVRNA